jgi:hypothetical protein
MSAAAHPSYSETIDAIKAACARIVLSYSGDGDGRIVSAIKETEYLAALKTSLEASHPAFTISIPKERYWYDIRINNIPINLKLTTGGTDNAFNKVAILYSITGVEVTRRNMNFDAWYGLIRSMQPKVERDRATEYHYLAVHKTTGAVILKPIFDIHTYKANPCNDLQINWRNEFAHADYVCPSHHAKTQELLRTVQASVLAAHASARVFADADFGPGAVAVTADD